MIIKNTTDGDGGIWRRPQLGHSRGRTPGAVPPKLNTSAYLTGSFACVLARTNVLNMRTYKSACYARICKLGLCNMATVSSWAIASNSAYGG